MLEYFLGIATFVAIVAWFDKLGVWATWRRFLLTGVWKTPKQLTLPPSVTYHKSLCSK